MTLEIAADGLAKQDKDNLDLSILAADTPEVISRQVLNTRVKRKKTFRPQLILVRLAT